MPDNMPNPQHPTALDHDIQVGRPLLFRKDAPAKTAPVKPSATKAFNAPAKPGPLRKARYDAQGRSALYRAAGSGDMRTLKRLLKEGWDPSQPCRDDIGETPLMVAGRNCHTAALQALLAAGAKVKTGEIDIAVSFTIGHCRSEEPQNRADMALIDGWLAQRGSRADLSPFMHSAALANDLPLIEKLVRSGADINHRCDWSRPYSMEKGSFIPVMCAIGGNGDNLECVRGMLTLGADAKEALNYLQNRRRTGDEPLAATPLGALLIAAADTGKILTRDEAGAAAHEGLVRDMLAHPPPGLKYSGRPINRNAVEAHIRKYRR